MGGTFSSGCVTATTQQQQPAEITLAKMLRDDLGVEVNEQALRMFIRWRWDRIQTLAHRIHDGNK